MDAKPIGVQGQQFFYGRVGLLIGGPVERTQISTGSRGLVAGFAALVVGCAATTQECACGNGCDPGFFIT